MEPLLVYYSKTGNTTTFVDFLKEKINLNSVRIRNNPHLVIGNYDKIILGCSTYNGGKIPTKFKLFLINNRENFKGKDVVIFGSGLSIYPNFCGAVDGIEKIVSDCGANVLKTFKFEQRFNEEEYDKDFISHIIDIIR